MNSRLLAKYADDPKQLALYLKFEPLVYEYAAKIYNTEYAGLEKEDIEQDLRMRVFTSVKAYLAKWAEYKVSGKYKPVPMHYYMCSALSNKIKDYIKKLSPVTKADVRWVTMDNVDRKFVDLRYAKTHMNVDMVEKVSVDECFDVGEFCTLQLIIQRQHWEGATEDVAILNGVDLLNGLVGRKRKCFLLFITGVEIRQLQAIYKFSGFDAKEVINDQLKLLRNKRNELLDYEKRQAVLHVFEN